MTVGAKNDGSDGRTIFKFASRSDSTGGAFNKLNFPQGTGARNENPHHYFILRVL